MKDLTQQLDVKDLTQQLDAGQNQQAVFDPLPSMFETAAAVKVFTAQKGVAHAT